MVFGDSYIMNKHQWTVLLLCIVIPHFCYSQNIDIQSFSLEDGLSQSSIHAFHEDSYGIIWMSTGDGLNAFDGHTINNYFLSPIQNLNPAGNSFRNIISDSIGNLYVGSDKGLFYFNRARFELIPCFSDTDKMMNFAGLPLYFCNDTLYALIQSQGLIHLNTKTGKFKLDKSSSSISHLEIFLDRPNEKWTGRFPNELVNHQLNQNKIIESRIALDFNHWGLNVTLLKLNPVQSLLIYGESVIRIDYQNDSLRLVDLSKTYKIEEHEAIKAGCLLDNGEIWLVTESDSVLSYLDGKFQQSFIFQQANRGGQKLSNIAHLFTDSEQRIWIGTDGCGFGIVKQSRPAFSPVNTIQTTDSLIINPFIRSFTEDNQANIWIGTYKTGLLCYNPVNQSYKSYKLGRKTEFPSLNDIYSLAFRDPILFVGTSKGVVLFNTTDKTMQYPVNHDSTASILRVSGIQSFSDKKFIIHINKKIKWLTETHDGWKLEPGPFPDSLTIDYLLINQDTLLGFTTHGLYSYCADDLEFIPYRFEDKSPQIKVNSAVLDPSGKFWIASNAGLFEMRQNGSIIKNYSVQDGLPSHYLYGILTDQQSNLWITTNGGLSCFDKKSKRFRNYSSEDGLQSMEFNTGAYFTSKAGNMYFGGINGFNCISGNYAKKEDKFPRIYLRNLFILDAPANLTTPIISLKKIDLPYYKNTISFEFEAIDFCDNKAHPFEYQLENHDQQWIFAGNNKLIRYSRLVPGEYHLKIRCVGDPDDNRTIRILVIIRKPFWQEWYIILPFFLLILLSFYLFVRFVSTRKMKKQIARLEQEREIHQVKARIASDLHDEIGTGLSKLAMLTDSMKLSSRFEEEVKQKLNDLSCKARLMTDQLRTIVWTLDPADDSMKGLIAYLRMKISEFLDERTIKLVYQISDEIPDKPVTAEFRRNVYYAVLESVHNVIKHAQADEIHVIIGVDGIGSMQIEIMDTGIGFNPESDHSFGHGLNGIRKRMEELGGSFQIKTAINQGTKLLMQIPI